MNHQRILQQYKYNARGQIIGVVDGNQNPISYDVDSWGRITGIGFADGVKEGYEYTPAGQVSRTIDGNGNAVQYRYNSLGKISERIDQLGFTETFRYDEEGNLSLHIDRDGRQLQRACNVFGQPVYEKASDAEGKHTNISTWHYDSLGRFSCLTVLGIYLIFHFDTRYRLGIAFGLASAAAAAALAVFFRKYRAKYSSVTVMSWQLTGGFVSALALLPAYLALMPPQNVLPQPIDWLWLIIFSTFCTLGMYILQIQSLEKISAFTVNLSYNLEPVYSIVLAMILFGEAHELGLEFYGGLALICLSVALQTGSVLTTQRRLKRIAERKAREAQYRANPPND